MWREKNGEKGEGKRRAELIKRCVGDVENADQE